MDKKLPFGINDSNIDIHKIIDDSMAKGDRSVSIFINKDSVTVNVYPYVEEKHCWIQRNDKDYPECSNCGYRDHTWDCSTYCPDCGEQMHGVKHEIDDVINKIGGRS